MDLDSERQARIQDAMREAGLDALLCAAPSHVLLLTGYWPVMAASVALVARSGEVHVIAPEDERTLVEAVSGATLTTYLPGRLEEMVDPVQALAKPLLSLLDRLQLSRASLGLELGYGVQPASYLTQVHFRASLADVLRDRQPAARIHSCDALVERLKAVKTPRELDLIRQACTDAAAGFAAAEAAVHPGARENEVAAAALAGFERTLPSPLAGVPASERRDGHFFCMSGPNSATASAAFARTRTREIAPDDLVMIHANTAGNGYWTDITRTFTARATPSAPPPARHRQMRQAISEATAAALAAIRPGARSVDVDLAARKVMQGHGFGEKEFVHGVGHGVGFAAANANALPRIHPASPDILEAGMTFNVEPAAYFPDFGGMRHCDVVAVTPTGADVLTNF